MIDPYFLFYCCDRMSGHPLGSVRKRRITTITTTTTKTIFDEVVESGADANDINQEGPEPMAAASGSTHDHDTTSSPGTGSSRSRWGPPLLEPPPLVPHHHHRSPYHTADPGIPTSQQGQSPFHRQLFGHNPMYYAPGYVAPASMHSSRPQPKPLALPLPLEYPAVDPNRRLFVSNLPTTIAEGDLRNVSVRYMIDHVVVAGNSGSTNDTSCSIISELISVLWQQFLASLGFSGADIHIQMKKDRRKPGPTWAILTLPTRSLAKKLGAELCGAIMDHRYLSVSRVQQGDPPDLVHVREYYGVPSACTC